MVSFPILPIMLTFWPRRASPFKLFAALPPGTVVGALSLFCKISSSLKLCQDFTKFFCQSWWWLISFKILRSWWRNLLEKAEFGIVAILLIELTEGVSSGKSLIAVRQFRQNGVKTLKTPSVLFFILLGCIKVLRLNWQNLILALWQKFSSSVKYLTLRRSKLKEQ